MRRTRISIALLVLSACFSWSLVVADDAYDHETWKNGYFGTSTYGGFLSGGGMYSLSVNKYTGGYNLHIPILSLPGRAGHDLNLYLSYGSKQFWLEKAMVYDYDLRTYVHGFNSYSYLPGPHQGRWVLNIWPSLKEESPGEYLFTTPDGAVHRLHQYAGGWYIASDGSYIAYSVGSKHVAYPSGEFFDFSEYDTNHRVHYVDRNGNRITYVFGSYYGSWRPVQIIDTLGREIDFTYGDSYWGFVTQIRVQNHAGQDLTFDLQYQTITADLAAYERYGGTYRPYYGSSNNAAYPGRVLTRLTLPNSTSCDFSYAFDHIYVSGYPPYYDASTFQLSHLSLPTGGSLDFSYASPPMPYGYAPGTPDYWYDLEPYAERLSRRIGSITVDPLDGYPFTTTYQYQRDSSGNVTQTTEIKPDGSRIVTTFNVAGTADQFLRNVEEAYDTDGTTLMQTVSSYWTETDYGRRISTTQITWSMPYGSSNPYHPEGWGTVSTNRVYDSMGRLIEEKTGSGTSLLPP